MVSHVVVSPTEVPPLEQLLAGAYAFSVPLTHRFRRVDHREGLLIEGPSGWGEFAPFVGYDAPTVARWLAAAIESAYGSWPSVVPTRVAVNAIIPAVAIDAAVELARAAVDQHGCRTIKVKVAEPMQSLDDDAARLRALRAAVGGDVAIRIDANAAWSLPQARTALPILVDAAEGIEYVEQPCASLDEIAQLRDAMTSGDPGDGVVGGGGGGAVGGGGGGGGDGAVRIAVDEALRLDADPFDAQLHAKIRAAADVLIVKVAPLGGIAAAHRIAEAVGLPVVVSSAMDTSVGLSAAATLAALLDTANPRPLRSDSPSSGSPSRGSDSPGPSGGSLAHGLGSRLLLAADVTRSPLVPRDGSIPVGRVEVDRDLLAAATKRLTPDRITWWHQRLRDAYPHLPPSFSR